MLLISVYLTFAMPVLVAYHTPFSGLIYGFALWQAWLINRKTKLVFTGPFRVSAGSDDARSPEVHADGG